ncbi:hypothetical protein Godav_011047 [Gossypium davidsonii]|uniref:Glycosyltransferases n=1 Tax=Gossypium davidsonii TaxID=34287 RepID=A0A7J8R8Y0_GOSDV|nr:hypothetical protein [Gossypium davidsonii]
MPVQGPTCNAFNMLAGWHTFKTLLFAGKSVVYIDDRATVLPRKLEWSGFFLNSRLLWKDSSDKSKWIKDIDMLNGVIESPLGLVNDPSVVEPLGNCDHAPPELPANEKLAMGIQDPIVKHSTKRTSRLKHRSKRKHEPKTDTQGDCGVTFSSVMGYVVYYYMGSWNGRNDKVFNGRLSLAIKLLEYAISLAMFSNVSSRWVQQRKPPSEVCILNKMGLGQLNPDPDWLRRGD